MKLGHGGTLDPLATGVLIVGVGSGTKALPSFLSCTKTYETVVLFGASSDTYDTESKVVARARYDHLTKEIVEKALDHFRGKTMQIPPLWSAIRVDGKHMYEYAREGKEPPRKLVERPMETTEVTLLEWLPGGTHQWNWPEQEAPKDEKVAAAKLLRTEKTTANDNQASTVGQKRKEEDDDRGNVSAKKAKIEDGGSADIYQLRDTEATSQEPTQSPVDVACPAPAARIRLTVSSGFYVRSFAHDLGQAIGSLGIMAHLVRSRQGDFELGGEDSRIVLEKDNTRAQDQRSPKRDVPTEQKSREERIRALEYAELAKGEESWGPKVEAMLEAWNSRVSPTNKNLRAQQRRNSSSPESE